MRLSNKDIVLLFGIVIAVVVTLTTIVYQERKESAKREVEQQVVPKKTSLNKTAAKVIRELIGTVESGRIN